MVRIFFCKIGSILIQFQWSFVILCSGIRSYFPGTPVRWLGFRLFYSMHLTVTISFYRRWGPDIYFFFISLPQCWKNWNRICCRTEVGLAIVGKGFQIACFGNQIVWINNKCVLFRVRMVDSEIRQWFCENDIVLFL